ncbi:hypothetical protein L1987_51305 [Smallanthus sonchifolius]|uniref:Uncharacterized protein n=1 Tax=Smallanthus sonchifolius TaxID=185202 RepID=A0ACB9EQL9_9ASTR|nr:hypothetical protein L1987_51305 [Smallanthus sonchifolius]
MIQELFGGNASGVLEPSPSPSPSSSTTTATVPAATTDTQKLRCPRCDSSHTKFCYYNNYNLTQPRHFCKTCRRYWTKGGALRNVPIGGGCRKNKGTTIAAAIGKPTSATGKYNYKAVVSSEIGKSVFMNGFEHDQSNHNPILWSTPPQTSHLLSLFRATQNPNPNFPSNPVTTHKDQGFMIGSNMGSLGFEPIGQASSLGLTSLWRNNLQDHQNQNQHEQHDQLGLRSSSSQATYYHHDQTAPLILGSSLVSNTSSTTSTSTTILDSAPVLASGELGFWNQTLPWSDLAAANGAYP